MYNKVKKKCGVYKIENKENGDFYIGSSVNIDSRIAVHQSLLRRNKHPNVHLQRAWNKYGESCFSFEILLRSTRNSVKVAEQYLLNKLNPTYNLSKLATGASGVTTDKMREATRKTGLAQKGKKKPKSYSEKLSKRMVGNKLGLGKQMSQENKDKLSKRSIGNKYFEGKTHTEEYKKLMSEKLKGRKFSDETRRKMSESAKLRKARELAEKEGSKLCLTM